MLCHVSGHFNPWDDGRVRQKSPVHLFLFFLASLEIQSAYDNHRLLILSTGRDKNFSQRSWELTSLLRMSSWCLTQHTFPKRQMWTFCCRYEETEMVMSLNLLLLQLSHRTMWSYHVHELTALYVAFKCKETEYSVPHDWSVMLWKVWSDWF